MYEFDTSTDFDPAPSGTGPWLHFYIKPSADNSIPAGAWSLTDAGTRHILDLSDGFILDWRATLTGWVQGTGVPGVAPVKLWNPSRAKFMPRPPGGNWHRGFLVPIAYENDAAAVWEQWGAGIFMGFSEMFVTLMQSAVAAPAVDRSGPPDPAEVREGDEPEADVQRVPLYAGTCLPD
jgi:hypothetical protein